MPDHTYDPATARFLSLVRLAPATAHALRGAVSTLAIHTELLASSVVDDDPALAARQRRWLAVLDEERRRLACITERFVAEVHLPDPMPGVVDLGALVADVLALLGPYAVDARVPLQAASPVPAARTETSRDGLLQLLIECGVRAIDASPRGTAVSMGVTAGPDGVRVHIGHAGAAAGTPASVPHALETLSTAAGGRLAVLEVAGGGVGFVIHLDAAAEAA